MPCLRPECRWRRPLRVAALVGAGLASEAAAKTGTVFMRRLERHSFCSTDADSGWKLDWEDHFDSDKLDASAWEVVTSTGRGNVRLPVAGLNVTACREAECRRENVRIHDGQLIILSERDPDGRLTSGAVTTKGRRAWSGDHSPFRLCVRARLPGIGGGRGQGIWPAHWMLPENNRSDRCLDEGEMDITEMINADGTVYHTYHWLTSWPQMQCGDFETHHKSVAKGHRVQDFGGEFHEYAVERTRDRIVYAVDGRVVFSASAAADGFTLSKSPFYLILNTALGGAWPGPISEETELPAEHAIDSVRVVRPITP
mmetsp:Transcript_29220/g.82986  ORF Transcript_29220/g.82986 Transcript_29220/m.82986 type:complete len:313 (-) Transcript_29220:120-1058(-)